MAGFGLHDATRLAAAFDAAKGFQVGEILVFDQSLGRNHHAGPGLLAAMPGSLLTRDRVIWRQLADTGPGVRQQRVLVGLQRQAIIAATFGDGVIPPESKGLRK